MLSGKVYCRECGRSMVGNMRHSGSSKTLYVTYRCLSRKTVCHNKEINRDSLEHYIVGLIEAHILNSSSLRKLKNKILKYMEARPQEDNADDLPSLREIEDAIRNVTDAIEAGLWNRARKKDSEGHRNTHQSKPEESQVIIEDSIPVIIPKEQFARVQTMIDSRRGGKASISSANYYLLGGLDILVCSACGSRLVGKTVNRSGKRYYYCPKHKRKECSMVDIKAGELEDFVTKRLVYEI